ELVPVWELLQPRNKKDISLERLKWYERLLALKPESVEGRMAAARVAMEEGLWGQARNYLGLAEEQGEEDARLYRLWAELEDRSTQNESAAQRWLERAEESPPPRCWVCRETGRIYPVWSPVAE